MRNQNYKYTNEKNGIIKINIIDKIINILVQNVKFIYNTLTLITLL